VPFDAYILAHFSVADSGTSFDAEIPALFEADRPRLPDFGDPIGHIDEVSTLAFVWIADALEVLNRDNNSALIVHGSSIFNIVAPELFVFAVIITFVNGVALLSGVVPAQDSIVAIVVFVTMGVLVGVHLTVMAAIMARVVLANVVSVPTSLTVARVLFEESRSGTMDLGQNISQMSGCPFVTASETAVLHGLSFVEGAV
jgi:hypothetical protein